MVGSVFLHRDQAADFHVCLEVDQSSEQQPSEPLADKSTQDGAITIDDPHSSSTLAVNQGSPPRLSKIGYIRHSIGDAYRRHVSSLRPSATSENIQTPQ